MYKDIQMNKRETQELVHLKSHDHHGYEIILVKDGASTFNINQKRYEVEAPSLIFINHLETHSVEVTKVPYNTFYLCFNKESIKTFVEDPILYSILINRPESYSHVLPLNENAKSIINIIESLYQEYTLQESFSHMVIKSQFQTLFIFLYRYYTHYFPIKMHTQLNHLILDIQDYIDTHYEHDLTLEQLAKTFFISTSYLSRSFKEITGYNVKEYIILQRLSKATELLLYSSLSVLDICNASGFNNVNHFNRAFKNHVGLTPNEYRHQYKRKE